MRRICSVLPALLQPVLSVSVIRSVHLGVASLVRQGEAEQKKQKTQLRLEHEANESVDLRENLVLIQWRER